MRRGGVFFLEKGAKLRDSSSSYDEISALEGGIAYLTDDETYLQLDDTVTI